MAFNVGSIIGYAKLDTTDWTKGQKTLNSSFKAMKTGIAVVGTAVAGALIGSIKIANDFNKEFSNVRTLIDETKVNTAAMKQELLGLDARLGSSRDLAKGLYQALSAGVDAGEAVKFVGEAAKFATAALTDTNTAVDVITTALNAYQMGADKAEKVSDIFFKTVEKGKITGQELATSIGSVIPTASTLGISLEELGASIATMTKQGINSANATTQLNAIMTAFLKPSAEMSAALKEVGFESGSALIESEGLTGALKFLEEATGGNKEALAKLLPNQRAIKGAFALTGQQAEVYNDTLKDMVESAGATDKAFQKQEVTFKTLTNTVEKIAIKVGDVLLPAVYELTTGVTNFISSADGMNKIATAMAGIAATFAIAKDIIMDLITPLKETFVGIIDTLEKSFAKLSEKTGKTINVFSILAGITKRLGIGFRVVGKTVELVIEGIADLILAIIESGKTISTFFNFLTGKASWDEVKENAKSTGEAFKEFGLGVANNFSNIIGNIKEEFNKLPDEVENLSVKMKNSWDNVFEKTRDSIQGGLTNIKKDISEGIDDMSEEVTAGGEEINKDWTKIMADFGTKFEEGFSKAAKVISFFVDTIGNAFNSIADIVTTSMENQLAEIEAEGAAELEILINKKDVEIATEEEKVLQEKLILDQKLANNLLTDEQHKLLTQQSKAKHDKKMAELDKKHGTAIEKQKDEQRKKENKQKKKMFDTQKSFDIANVWIQAASGVIAAWAGSFQALGWIPMVGPGLAIAMASVMSGLILGTAIGQTVAISQQQFTPSAATGGTVTSPGMVRTDEAGAEIKKYNTGDLIIPNEISQQIGRNVNGGKGATYNISFAGANISNNMSLKKVTDYVIKEIGKRVKFA